MQKKENKKLEIPRSLNMKDYVFNALTKFQNGQ